MTKISEIMPSDLITVDAETLLGDALKVPTVGKLRTVPIVEGGECLGILDIRDLYAGLQRLLDEQIELDEDIIGYAFGEAYGGR